MIIMEGVIKMSERIINTWRDPYGEGFSICKPKQVTIKQGLTVLVGCNGIGKTTFLHNIKDELKKEKIPYYYFDNLKDGGSWGRSKAAFEEDFTFLATASCSSEGENITMNICKIAFQLKRFMKTGKVSTRSSKMTDALLAARGEKVDKVCETKERWLLLDAVDSGYSIDNVIDLKNLFQLVIDDYKNNGYELFIVCSANEYELANGEDCFDVTSGEYIRFKSYGDYKNFILDTKEKKDRRYEKQK